MDQTDPLVLEVRRLIAVRDLGQYALVKELGIGSGTARRLLGKDPGPVDAETLALVLRHLGHELWHRKTRRRK